MSDKTRPLWWPRCPYPAEEFKMGDPRSMFRTGWERAETEIYERLEREMHRAATQPVNLRKENP